MDSEPLNMHGGNGNRKEMTSTGAKTHTLQSTANEQSTFGKHVNNGSECNVMSSARRQKGLTGYCFKDIGRPFCL